LRHDGLQAVSVIFTWQSYSPVLLKITDQPGAAAKDLAALNLNDIMPPGYYRFEFNPSLI
jgi:hypothetical protein